MSRSLLFECALRIGARRLGATAAGAQTLAGGDGGAGPRHGVRPAGAASAADGPAIARISAAEIGGAVIAQVRGLLRQPEVVLGAWRAARVSAPDMTEDEARLALERLDPLWDELFPAEQARIIRLLVDRVDIGTGGADVRLKLEGLASLARDLATPAESARVAA
ncbi:MAG: hypothetical protein O9325_11015 [Roseomonas sp.]|nr:hypothetical protein [Roseomonas sp.]